MKPEIDQKKIWDHFQVDNKDSFAESHPRLDFLVAQLDVRNSKTSLRILNIGLGDAYFEKQAISAGHKVTSLDISEKSVANAKNLGIDAHYGTVTKMQFANASFDIIVASEVLEHLTSDELVVALKEVKRTLAPNGRFIGTVPFNEKLSDNRAICPNCSHHFHRWGHHASFTPASLKEILEPLGRTRVLTRAFPELTKRSVAGRVRGHIRQLFGALGYKIALPNIYFEVQVGP